MIKKKCYNYLKLRYGACSGKEFLDIKVIKGCRVTLNANVT